MIYLNLSYCALLTKCTLLINSAISSQSNLKVLQTFMIFVILVNEQYL